MRTYLIPVLLLAASAFAQTPVIVEQVEGQKATVYIPPNVVLKPGDMLHPHPMPTQNVEGLISIDAPSPNATDNGVAASNKRRGRTNNIEITYSRTTAKYDYKEVYINHDTTYESLELAYGYDLGQVRPWFAVTTELTKDNDSSAKVRGGSVALGVRLNLIPNVPGNDVVPYVSAGLGYTNVDVRADNVDTRANGNFITYELGISWYPFHELFAFNLGYGWQTGDLDVTGEPLPDKVDIAAHGVYIGYTLSFD